MNGKAATAWVGLALAAPALAADAPPPEVRKCERPLGSVAMVEGDAQGWTKFGLSGPRELITALVTESGCFTLHNPASGQPATWLMNVVAGSKEEVDQGMKLAGAAATEALVRTGAASGLMRGVPMGGALLGAFSGFGGKKKTVAAGIRMISPQNGQTIVSGSGDASSSSISFGGASGAVAQGLEASGYGGSKDGKMLAEAFIEAFNAVTAQGSTLASMAAPAPAVSAPAAATAAIDTAMLSAPQAGSAVVRKLRAGTAVRPTGKRQGVWAEVSDGLGSSGWVSVEDLK